MVPFQKMARIGQQKRYHLGIFHLAPLNSLKLNPLLTSGMKKRGLKWYHFRIGQNFAGTVAGEQILSRGTDFGLGRGFMPYLSMI